LKFPRTGVLIAITDFGNNAIIGQEFSVVPNLSYRFRKFGKFEFSGTVGIGIAWFNKPYNRISNPENKFIGSRIANKTIFIADLDYTLSRSFRISAGISYRHYSNGHNQLPNVGINIPAFQLGVKYFPEGFPEHFYTSDSVDSIRKKWLFNLRIGLGIHKFGDPVKPAGGPKYPVYSGSVYLSKRLGVILNLHAGLHVNYYLSYYDFIDFHDLYDGNWHSRSLTVIGFSGIEFLLGNFSFTTQMGIYLYNPAFSDITEINGASESFKNNMKKYLSYKLGAQYYLFQTRQTTRFNPLIGIFLKTNAGQADFSEISFGCAF
jgi:hypothetical protein